MQAQPIMYVCRGTNYTDVDLAKLGAMPFRTHGSSLTLRGVTYVLATISLLTFATPTFVMDVNVVLLCISTTDSVDGL